jgi:hypothetical protein
MAKLTEALSDQEVRETMREDTPNRIIRVALAGALGRGFDGQVIDLTSAIIERLGLRGYRIVRQPKAKG